MATIERRSGWSLAEHAGDMSPGAMQGFLVSRCFDRDKVRDQVRSALVSGIGDTAGVLIADETGFIKKGRSSAGVQRQCTGTTGKIDDWVSIPIRAEFEHDRRGWVLARRNISTGELAYYVCFGPRGIRLRTLVRTAGARWAVEESFQIAKNEAGSDPRCRRCPLFGLGGADDTTRRSSTSRRARSTGSDASGFGWIRRRR